MLTTGSTMTAVLAAALLLGVVRAEAPLPYHYPAPSGPGNSGSNALNLNLSSGNNNLQQTPPAVINNGIISSAGQNYVGPSQLIASPPPAIQSQDFPVQFNNNEFQDADVHKHVYVHVAPEEPAERQASLVVPTVKPKKHYKIVFIKTPTVLPPAATYVNLPQPDQEKTLIYVLSKKPELKQSLVFSTPAPTQPAKPEVFFIRYKTNEPQAQPQLVYAGGSQAVNAGAASAAKPLTNSYGVPLAPPLGLSGLQYPQGAPATAAPANAINYNTV